MQQQIQTAVAETTTFGELGQKLGKLLKFIQANNSYESLLTVGFEGRVGYRYVDLTQDGRDGAWKVGLRESSPEGFDREFIIRSEDDLDRIYGYLLREA